MPFQFPHHRMANEFRSQPAGLVQRLFEREYAHHEIKKLRHPRYPAPIPCPTLRADIVDEFPLETLSSQISGQAQIEPRIVNKNDCIRFDPPYLVIHLTKFLAKIGIFDEHVPETHDRLVRPIQKWGARHL